jgi:hypothetical protein
MHLESGHNLNSAKVNKKPYPPNYLQSKGRQIKI